MIGVIGFVLALVIIGVIFLVRAGEKDKEHKPPEFASFPDKYETLDSVAEALQNEGLESCNIIFGIDYTASNESQGRRTFNGRSLHCIPPGELNPYQKVIQIIGKTLSSFDEDNLIPVYGFGDITTKDSGVFPFFEKRPCEGFAEVLDRYTQITPTRKLSGPTSFVPVIRQAIEIVKSQPTMQYHILIIIADGQVTNEKDNIQAIQDASNYPLSIIMVGVGDGPWETMEKFDDRITARRFDNFQFVDFNHVMNSSRYPDAAFALRALMEIPGQFNAVKKLQLLGASNKK